MDWTLEVVIVPVSDLAKSIAFYRDQIGFDLDHDTENEFMHVAQLTPRGSGCSIVMGTLPGQNQMTPGSLHGVQLCVADAEAARAELVGRGVACTDIEVFDARGRHVRTLIDGPLAAGTRRVSWDGHDDAGIAVASGVYVARLQTSGTTHTRRMTLLK